MVYAWPVWLACDLHWVELYQCGADAGVILGCTEIELLLRQSDATCRQKSFVLEIPWDFLDDLKSCGAFGASQISSCPYFLAESSVSLVCGEVPDVPLHRSAELHIEATLWMLRGDRSGRLQVCFPGSTSLAALESLSSFGMFRVTQVSSLEQLRPQTKSIRQFFFIWISMNFGLKFESPWSQNKPSFAGKKHVKVDPCCDRGSRAHSSGSWPIGGLRPSGAGWGIELKHHFSMFSK